MNFDTSKHYLGTLCKRDHEWENSEKSLRYFKRNLCVLCNKLRTQKYYLDPVAKEKRKKSERTWRKNNPKKVRQYYKKQLETGELARLQRQWRKRNPDRAKEIRKKHHLKYPEQKKNHDKKHYERHKEKIKKQVKKYYLNNKEKISKNSTIRARKGRHQLKKYYLKWLLREKCNIENSKITDELILIKKIYLMDYRNIREFKQKEVKKWTKQQCYGNYSMKAEKSQQLSKTVKPHMKKPNSELRPEKSKEKSQKPQRQWQSQQPE